jgi:signal transduction histidine kinase
MNGYRSSAKAFSEREFDLQRVSDFHAVLLGMAAHDLRQPLQVIQSTYEWLNGRFDAEGDRMRLQRGERAVAGLAEQLDRLAAALRLYQHTTTMELSPVPLAPLFDSLRAENVEFARQKGIELRVRPTRAVVVSNAVILDGIVRNLVRNAVKYTDAGHVLLSCRRRGPYMCIDIYDTGIGMSADQLPRAFEAFQRLDSTRSSGLGLGTPEPLCLTVSKLPFRRQTGRRVARSSHRNQLRLAIFSAGERRPVTCPRQPRCRVGRVRNLRQELTSHRESSPSTRPSS